MADPAPVGSDVSAGTYRCTNCGYELSVQSVQSLPPCPKCDGPQEWEAQTGGDSERDPYPEGQWAVPPRGVVERHSRRAPQS